MSQFYSSCKLRLSFAIIGCILFSQLLMPTEANSGMITSTSICSSLNVGHGPNAIPSNFTVTVSLVHTVTKERSFCYEASTNYTINMRTNAQTFKGLLMVQDKPDGKFPTSSESLPPNFRFDLCERSVSHHCSQSCDLGASLNFPYTSPTNKNNILEFRYSVVYSYKMYDQNVKVQFHPCDEPTSSIPSSSSMLTCNASEYKVQESTYKAHHTCPNSPKTFLRHHSYTENNIDYNCTINGKTIRRKVCGSGCLENRNGEVLCCRVRHNDVVMRNSTCIAISDVVPEDKRVIHKKFKWTNQRRCVCFHCKDVCPSEITETATDDSNNVETSRSDSSAVEIDGNMLS